MNRDFEKASLQGRSLAPNIAGSNLIASLRLGLWPAIVLCSLAFGALLGTSFRVSTALGFALALIASLGFLVNDNVDAEIDRTNKVSRWSPKSTFDILIFYGTAGVLLFGSAVLATTLDGMMKIGVSLALMLVIAYSYLLKRIFFIGNVVAVLLSISPALIHIAATGRSGNAATDTVIVATLLVSSSYLFLLSREVRFDEFDIEGDRVSARLTLPMVFGRGVLDVFHTVLVVGSIAFMVVAIVYSAKYQQLGIMLLSAFSVLLVATTTVPAYLSSSKVIFYKLTRIPLFVFPLIVFALA
jgi:4-hydroxybenzoate polyprenyltransferase